MSLLPEKSNSLKTLFRSFSYGFRGIFIVMNGQRNFRIHLLFTVLVIIAGFIFNISSIEWCLLMLTIALVLSLEIINTSIEKLVDLVSPEYNPHAGQIKDIAAGGVLISALMAIVIGLIIFVPKIIHFSI